MSETIGQAIDLEVAALKTKVAALEAAAIAKEHSLVTWFAKNWVHVSNGLGIAGIALKVFGKL